jgi:hypothetical protein
MRNPFQIAPRCVQWAAVTLLALPVFNIVVALNVTSFGRFLSLWRITLPNIGVQLGLSDFAFHVSEQPARAWLTAAFLLALAWT